MSCITRYVIGELTRVFLVSVLVMTTMMVMVFLVQEAWRENLTPETILELIPFTIPTALSFAIPGTVLFATCIVYGRMSSSNEIVAIKSLGVPPTLMIWPGLVLAFVLSLVTLYLNDIAVSWGRGGIYRVVLDSSAKTIYSVLNAQDSFKKGNMSISVHDIQGDTLIDAHIERGSIDPADRLHIHAAKARISVAPTENVMIFHVENARIELGDVTLFFDERSIPIPLGDVTKKTRAGRSPSNLALREMKSELIREKAGVARLQKQLAMGAAIQMIGGNMMAMTQPSWHRDLKNLEGKVFRKHRLRTEPWRRWANGFSCLCFVLVGAPLSIRMRKSDFWTIFAVCFIPILLLYYPLLMFGVANAKSGFLPPYAVWIGNIMMASVGIWLIRGIKKH